MSGERSGGSTKLRGARASPFEPAFGRQSRKHRVLAHTRFLRFGAQVTANNPSVGGNGQSRSCNRTFPTRQFGKATTKRIPTSVSRTLGSYYSRGGPFCFSSPSFCGPTRRGSRDTKRRYRERVEDLAVRQCRAVSVSFTGKRPRRFRFGSGASRRDESEEEEVAREYNDGTR